MTGVTVGVIQNYESKRSELYYENAHVFADALNIDVDLLLDDYTRFTSPGFGDKIKSIRQQMGLSQSRFATELGVTRTSISFNHTVSISFARGICRMAHGAREMWRCTPTAAILL